MEIKIWFCPVNHNIQKDLNSILWIAWGKTAKKLLSIITACYFVLLQILSFWTSKKESTLQREQIPPSCVLPLFSLPTKGICSHMSSLAGMEARATSVLPMPQALSWKGLIVGKTWPELSWDCLSTLFITLSTNIFVFPYIVIEYGVLL